jgi:hypothetical protein
VKVETKPAISSAPPASNNVTPVASNVPLTVKAELDPDMIANDDDDQDQERDEE